MIKMTLDGLLPEHSILTESSKAPRRQDGRSPGNSGRLDIPRLSKYGRKEAQLWAGMVQRGRSSSRTKASTSPPHCPSSEQKIGGNAAQTEKGMSHVLPNPIQFVVKGELKQPSSKAWSQMLCPSQSLELFLYHTPLG